MYNTHIVVQVSKLVLRHVLKVVNPLNPAEHGCFKEANKMKVGLVKADQKSESAVRAHFIH